LPLAQYGTWDANRVAQWSPEDWRLFLAALLFSGLQVYENGKGSYGWQRESADMSALLKALFTADDPHNVEVGYRIRKRLAMLRKDSQLFYLRNLVGAQELVVDHHRTHERRFVSVQRSFAEATETENSRSPDEQTCKFSSDKSVSS
jgi:hypothetical protein